MCKAIITLFLISPTTPLFAQIVFDQQQCICQGGACTPQLPWEAFRGDAPTYHIPIGEQQQTQWGPVPARFQVIWLPTQQCTQFGQRLMVQSPENLIGL